MAKLSKREISLQKEILEMIDRDEPLEQHERDFIYAHFDEAYYGHVSQSGAFFTPVEMAKEFHLDVPGGRGSRVVDLCAGIGMLSYIQYKNNYNYDRPKEIVCVELNPEFVRIGKKLLPEATWICGDVLDKSLWEELGPFDAAYGNPPFSKIKSTSDTSWLSYTGPEFEFKVMEVAARVADRSAFLIPQTSAPFKCSGQSGFSDNPNAKYTKFLTDTGVMLTNGIGIDFAFYQNDWKNTSMLVESVCIDLEDQLMGYDVQPKVITLRQELATLSETREVETTPVEPLEVGTGREKDPEPVEQLSLF